MHASCQHAENVSRLLQQFSLALALVLALGCGDTPLEPRGEGERVPVGTVIEQEVTGDSARWYSFAARPNGVYAVFLEALQGIVSLVVLDSAHHSFIAGIDAHQGGARLEENPTSNFLTTAAGVYLVSVSTFPAGASARFRFMVYEINTAPEKVPARFAIGDTVAGETIDPIVDGDRFFADGTAGQDVVLVMETLGPQGSGSVSLDVVDPTTNTLLGYVFGDAGTPTLTTGRLRLPGSHDYRFSAWAVRSNVYPRYRGPYRFWSYLINRAPEHRTAAIPVDSEVRGEMIDRAGDVDEFTFTATAAFEYNAFVQAPRAVQLEVARLSGQVLATAKSSAADTGLFNHPTGRFQVPLAGTYIVRVAGTAPSQIADTGAYRLFLYQIDRRPEHVSATITLGDTVSGEAIDLPGDIDEFTFSGAAGEELNAFLQAQSGSPETHLQLEVLDGGGTLVSYAQSVGTDTSLLRQPTGRFALPSTGTYRLRVSGVNGGPSYPDELNRGAYRLFLGRINRRPETVPDTLAFGDSLSGEAIDLPGDVDEFRVTVRDSSGANLALEFENSPAGGVLAVQLVDSATGRVVATASTFQAATRAATGRLRVAPGKYVVRVSADDYSILRAPYRLWFYRFSFGPEAVPDSFAIGDTVGGEVIQPWGDVDRFRFYGLRGQHINVALQGRADTSGGGFQAWISGPGGEPVWTFASVSSAASDATLRDHQTGRLDLPVTGWYHVEMSGYGSTRGAYRLLVEPLSALPEQVAAALAPGDSVTSESIDTPGDWDEYTVTATPGQELAVITHGRSGTTGPFAAIAVFDLTTRDTLASNVLQEERVVGPFRVPANGQVAIAVFEPASFVRFCYDATCGGVFGFVGPYRFQVIPIKRAPESIPAAFTVGDTIRGEAISPVGDIDEFTSSGTPGESLSPSYHLTADPVPPEGLITLEIVDPATGAVLLGTGAALYRASPDYYSPGSFTVPPNGTFMVRVHSYGLFGTGTATAPYEFFVKRGP